MNTPTDIPIKTHTLRPKMDVLPDKCSFREPSGDDIFLKKGFRLAANQQIKVYYSKATILLNEQKDYNKTCTSLPMCFQMNRTLKTKNSNNRNTNQTKDNKLSRKLRFLRLQQGSCFFYISHH